MYVYEYLSQAGTFSHFMWNPHFHEGKRIIWRDHGFWHWWAGWKNTSCYNVSRFVQVFLALLQIHQEELDLQLLICHQRKKVKYIKNIQLHLVIYKIVSIAQYLWCTYITTIWGWLVHLHNIFYIFYAALAIHFSIYSWLFIVL